MGLRTKISLLSAIVLAALALSGYIGLSATLLPAFDDLENRSSRADLARARHNLEGQMETLSRFSFDWSTWEATYRYMEGTNPGYVAVNVEPLTLAGLDINWLAIFDNSDQLKAGLFVDLGDEQPRVANDIAFTPDPQGLAHLTRHSEKSSEVQGVIDSDLGPLIVSSRPILRPDSTGPIAGTMIMGRLLDEARIAEIGRNAEIRVSLAGVDNNSQHANDNQVFGREQQVTSDLARVTSVTVHDVTGRAVASIQVESAREVTMLGAEATASALWLFVILGFLAIGILTLIVGKTIIRPTRELRAKLATIERGSEAPHRIQLDRQDEIGGLARSINNMLGRLDEMKQRNIEQSFKAGMAEVAAGLLHNVRNALMPAINNVSMAREAMIQKSDKNVSLAIEEIGGPDTDAERRGKLLEFLRKSHERSTCDRAAAVDYLGNVLDQLDQAADAVKEQEKFASPKPVLEQVKLGSVLDIAVGVIPSEVLAGVAIEIEPEARGIRVSAHRVPLMQVIGNVLMNAVDSILETGGSVGRISMNARRVDGGGKVALTVRDDGAGMTSEGLEQLFDRHFAAKEGARGHGLHWSANTLAGMGATISASSEGPGHGTEYRIMLQATSPRTMNDG